MTHRSTIWSRTPSIPADARFVSLRFAGALGSVDLKWEFVEPGQEHLDPIEADATVVAESP